MPTPKVRTFADLSAALQAKAGGIKAASAKKAAENDPTPEKDQTEKGTVAIPRDPDADPAKQNVPGSTTNADTQKTLPAPAVAKTVEGAEKVAGKDLSNKAASIADGIRKLATGLGKKAEVTQPNMPPNDKKNEGTDGGALKPPSGGAGAKNNPDSAVKDAAPKGEAAGAMPADKTNAGTAAMPKADGKGELPKTEPVNADQTKKAGMCTDCKCDPCKCDGKSAAEVPFDASFHLKLASIILSTDEGREFATAQIEKYHGAQAANDIIKSAAIMEQKADELAEMEQSGAMMAEEMWKSASETERAGIIKLAEVLTAGRAQYRTEFEKMAYDAGAGGAAQMADAGMMGMEAPPEEGAPGAEAGGAGAGGLQDQIVAALDQMVQSGELDPETAAQVLQMLTSGEGAEGAAGGDPAAAMGGDPAAAAAAMGGAGGGAPAAGGGAPAAGGGEGGEAKEKKEPEPDGDEGKEASAKSASNRNAVLKALKPKAA